LGEEPGFFTSKIAVRYGMASISRFLALSLGTTSLVLALAAPMHTKLDSLAALVKSYKSWHKVNKEPILMAPRLVVLCAGPPAWNGETNPHDPHYFTVYVNKTGEAAMASSKAPAFPVGTVIVKEKLNAAKDTKPELLTVMVKRAKGFDPANGDWEFYVADAKGRASQEKIQSCQSCHAKYAKEGDYVFRTYGDYGAVPVRRERRGGL
jgi:hypothetical protein